MSDNRTYRPPPRTVVIVHGGPGVCGELEPVAVEVSNQQGVVEPLLKGRTISSQLTQLRDAITELGEPPVTVIGHSWGAWLGLIFAAKHSELVRKVILIGCPPFDPSVAVGINRTRMSRFTDTQREEYYRIERVLEDHEAIGKHEAFARLAQLMAVVDGFDPSCEYLSSSTDYRVDTYQGVWPEASRLRSSGILMKDVGNITCPVVAIHGDYDPHPADGMRQPLETNLPDFRYILLENCGHMPWIERQARANFFEVLQQETTAEQ